MNNNTIAHWWQLEVGMKPSLELQSTHCRYKNFMFFPGKVWLEWINYTHIIRVTLWNDCHQKIHTGIYSNIWIDYTIYFELYLAWWRHQMETFSALLALCAGNSPVTGEFPAQRPVTQGFGVYFDLWLNKRLSKQSWGSLWRHCHE